MKKFVSIVLMVAVLVSMLAVCTFNVASAQSSVRLDYSFSGDEADKAGFAQGTISITVDENSAGGNYYIYWADDKKALDGYREITTFNVTGGVFTYEMLENTAIPPQATQIIAINSDTSPQDRTVSVASASFEIPKSKRLESTKTLYTFGAYSDPQIANDSYGSNSYPYDEAHFEKALETFASRNVDFLVSSGDTVNDQNGGVTYAEEYKRYQKILADSPFVNPVYEANGNHDVHVNWKSSTPIFNEPFVIGTGLDSDIDKIKENKAYFEITEPKTGDHFIFMAQEGGFYTDDVDQFTKEQIDWLEGLLKKYENDGKNIFILEHANVNNWGSGDKYPDPYYDLPLNPGTHWGAQRFVDLMETYKDCFIITGHTHLELSAHLNYSDNNGTSAVMMHNSAIGGVRRLVNGAVDRTPMLGMSEGYIVDVYEDCVIFNGTNLYYNEIMPDCTYIIPTSTSFINPEPPTEPEPKIFYGDVDLDGKVEVLDATAIQRHLAKLSELEGIQLINANVQNDDGLTIMDATLIQRKLAKLIDKFPAELNKEAEVDKISASDISALLTTAKDDLSKYYEYSSYDQYMALKKYVKELESSGDTSNEAYDKLELLHNELLAIVNEVEKLKPDTIDVYFTNAANWTKVNAYVWASGVPAKVSWPGSEMTYVETNSYSQKVYKYTIEAGKYTSIIFNNGSEQTEDLTLTNVNNQGFYTTTKSNGKYKCETYTYGN